MSRGNFTKENIIERLEPGYEFEFNFKRLPERMIKATFIDYDSKKRDLTVNVFGNPNNSYNLDIIGEIVHNGQYSTEK